MPNATPTVNVNTNVVASPSGTTNTAVAISNMLPATPTGGQGNYVSGVIDYTPTTSATAVVLKLYQGGSTTLANDTLVWTSPAFTVIAATPIAIPYAYLDQTAAIAGVSQYTLSMTGTGAGGTVNFITIGISTAGAEG